MNDVTSKGLFFGRLLQSGVDNTGNEDFSNLDNLVAIMTFPNYVPAMEKAAGFVTDEGGILCHAAIISREMQKTCIIGTKDATRVLHDGDLVELDGETGIVRKVG